MKLVCTAAQVRAMDDAVIRGLGVPGVALMEIASLGVARAVQRHHAKAARSGVVVVCGGGNNGGDGYGCARWLYGWGYPVRVLSQSASSKGDAAVLRRASAHVPTTDTLGDAGLIIDAVFGTGLSRQVTGETAALLTQMAQHRADVVAVDVPSGLSADIGQVLGVAVPAARTVTFGREKLGFYGEPGADYVGVVDVVDIGLEAAGGPHAAEIAQAEDIRRIWPERASADHKTRSGHLLVIAGSTEMAGAAVLTCMGALAAGAGLVTLLTCRGALPRLERLAPEVMVQLGGEGDSLDEIPPLSDRISAVVAGPGLGSVSSGVEQRLRALWSHESRPVLFDAGALRFVAGKGQGRRVITPHAGEAGRLLGKSAQEIQSNRFAAAQELGVLHGVALLKGRHSLIAEAERPLAITPTGNPVLASGGTGDVLTGVIGALLARGLGAREAAIAGAWVHGAAADALGRETMHGWVASDVARQIPRILP